MGTVGIGIEQTVPAQAQDHHEHPLGGVIVQRGPGDLQQPGHGPQRKDRWRGDVQESVPRRAPCCREGMRLPSSSFWM
jgi:hypothetical protein